MFFSLLIFRILLLWWRFIPSQRERKLHFQENSFPLSPPLWLFMKWAPLRTVANSGKRINKNHGIVVYLQNQIDLFPITSFCSFPIYCDWVCVYVCVLRNMKTINNGNTLLLVTHIARNKHRMLTWPHICFKCSKGMRKRMWTKRKWFHCVLQSFIHHFGILLMF